MVLRPSSPLAVVLRTVGAAAVLATLVGCPERATRPNGAASGVGSSDIDPPDAGQRCYVNTDCASLRCERGRCVPLPDADTGTDAADAADAPLDAEPPDAEADAGHPDAGPADTGPTDTGPADTGPAQDAAGRCVYNSDCPEDEVCLPDGRCGPECREDRDCNGDEQCHRGRCRGPGERCADPADCLDDEVCALGQCRPRPECIFGDDCAANQDCVNGECRDKELVGEGEGEGEGGPPVGEYGDPCRTQDDCRSGLCLQVAPPGSGGVCTVDCLGDAGCPGLDVCTPVGNRAVCAPNDAGRDCRDPIECNFGLCVNQPGGLGAVCSLPCGDAGRCPQSMGCGIVATAQGDVLWACLPVGGNCDRAAECPSLRCVPDAQGALDGYCSNDCRGQADCALGNLCCPIQGADGFPVNICIRSARCM